MRHFYDLTDSPQELISELLRLSDRLRQSPEPRALAGRVMGIVQLSPSLRTTVSFEAAMARLGGSTFLISPDRTSHGLTSQHGIVMDGTAAEHLSDVLPVLASSIFSAFGYLQSFETSTRICQIPSISTWRLV